MTLALLIFNLVCCGGCLVLFVVSATSATHDFRRGKPFAAATIAGAAQFLAVVLNLYAASLHYNALVSKGALPAQSEPTP